VILGIDQANAQILVLQGEHKVFPWLQTFITRKLLYVEYKYIYFFKNVTQEVILQQISICAKS